MTAVTHETGALRSATLQERLVAALPLTSVYVWLSLVYGYEAWRRLTPWLFTDELELTQLARSLAATGHPARRGEPFNIHSLYTVVTAPAWWLGSVAGSYSAVKYVDVFAMTSVVFPTYFLARMLTTRGWALFAAAGAGSVPALAYSSYIVEETWAYPYAALCLFLGTKALVVRRRGWIVAAVVAGLFAPAVRGELVVIPIVYVLAAAFVFTSSDWARARRRTWSPGDWLGTIALVAGALILIGAITSSHYIEWQYVSNYYKHRAVTLGNWAAGSFAIGLGLIPFFVGLAGLVPARGEPRSRELRTFRCVGIAAVIGFGLYTAMKASYLSTVFATRVEERNIIYIAPILFVATACVLAQRRVNLAALALAVAYTFYLVVGTPFQMNVQLYSDALGLAILEQANRFYELTPSAAQWILLGVLLGAAALVAAVHRSRGAVRLGAGLAAVLALGTLTWNVTAEIAAAAGTISIGGSAANTLRRPFSWVDEIAKRKPTIYLGQGVGDQDPEWLLEFWNRSISAVSSLDGTIQGPGPAGAPNVTPQGQLYWTADPADPGKIYDYAVEDWPCVDFAGTFQRRHLYRALADRFHEWRLIQLTHPNRLRATCTGIYPDGWSGADDSTYFRFSGASTGWLRIKLSRSNWLPSPATVLIGSIGESDREPALGTIRKRISLRLATHGERVVWLRVPASGFAVRVVIARKFVPRDLAPQSSSDPRTLGAQISYRFFTKKP